MRLIVAVVGVLLLIVLVTFVAGYSCNGCRRAPLPPVGIDAGEALRELDEREDAAIAQTQAELDRLEREHQAELDAFDEAQRRKYEHVRERGPEAVAAWLTEFNRRLRDGGT